MNRLLRILLLMALPLMFSRLEAQVLRPFPSSITWQGIYTDSIQVIFPKGYDTLAYTAYQRGVYIWQMLPTRPPKGKYVMRVNPFAAFWGFETHPISGEIMWNAGPKTDPHTGPIVKSMPAELDKAWFSAFIDIKDYQYSKKISTRIKRSQWHPEWFSRGYGALLTTTLNPGNQSGYIPSFMNPMRSMAFYRDLPRFSRVLNGSMRFQLPSQEHIGFLIQTQAALNGGRKFSDSLIVKRWKTPGGMSLQSLIKENGLGDVEYLYKTAKENYAIFWGKQLSEKYMDRPIINRFRYNSEFDFRDKGMEKGFLSFEHPTFVTKEEVTVLKKSMEGPPAVYIIRPNGRQVKVTDLNISESPYYSAKNDFIAWSEIVPDPVYPGISYSQVRFKNLRKSGSFYVAKKTRWYSPDIDEKGKNIVVIEHNDTTNEQNLILVQVDNGVELTRFPNPQGYQLYYPKITPDNSTVVVTVSNSKGEMALMAYDIATTRSQMLLPFTQHIIGIPSPGGFHIFFEASYGGVDNIFCYRVNDKEVFQVTGRDIASYQASLTSSEYKMMFTDYTPKGKQLLQVGETDPNLWINLNMRKITGTGLYAEKEIKNMSLGKNPKLPKKLPDAKKADTTDKFHQKYWGMDAAFENVGFYHRWESSRKSRNAQAGIQWRPNDPVVSLYGQMTWKPGLPEVDIRIEENALRFAGWYDTLSNFMMETRLSGGVKLPWEWKKKGNHSRLVIGLRAAANMLISATSELPAGVKAGLQPMGEAQFMYIWKKQKSPGDYLPMSGYFIRGAYRNAFSAASSMFAGQVGALLPGANRRHRIVISGGIEQAQGIGMPFRPYLNPLRGQLMISSSQNVISASAEYHLILFHLDKKLANTVQFRRMRANAFVDFAMWDFQKTNTILAGMEFTADLKWFDRHEFNLGLRGGYHVSGPQQGKVLYQLFLPLYIWN